MFVESGSIDTRTPEAQKAEAAVADVLARVSSKPRTEDQNDGPREPNAKGEGAFHYWKKHLMTLAVIRCVPLTGNATKVMLRLIAYANERSGVAWPSLDTLADETGLSRKVVKAAIANAEACKLLTIDRSTGGRHGETHTFRPAWHLAAKEGVPSRDRVRGPSGEATGSLQGSDGVPVGKGRGPSRAPEQVGEIRQEDIRDEESSAAHARDAGSDVPPGLERGKPSSTGTSREPAIPLPDGFGFDLADVEAAITRGHTKDSVTTASESFRRFNASKRKTASQWREAGRKWLGEERVPQVNAKGPKLDRYGKPLTRLGMRMAL